MFCPVCGTENPDASRYCANCGAVPVSRPAQYLSLERQVDMAPASLEMRTADITSEDRENEEREPVEFMAAEEKTTVSLWPSETVFAPTSDTDNERAARDHQVPLAIFEDDQADDVFEQSLSGVPLEAFAEAIDDGGESIPIPKSPLPSVIQLEVFAPEQFPVAASSVPAFEYVASSNARLVPKEAIVDKRNGHSPLLRGQKPVRIAGIILLVILFFGAGIGTGIWLNTIQVPVISKPADIPVVIEETHVAPLPPGMAYVTGGEFLMGSDYGDTLSKPAHLVKVEPFFIDRTEVTNEAYLKFVAETGHDPPVGWKNGFYPEGQGEFPVTGITWYEAAEYATWTGKRLPTEAEWEFAARGSDGRIYPWGNEWDPSLANVDNVSKGVRKVGDGGKSPFSIFDMSGNAWEWTASDAKPYSGGKDFPLSKLRLKVIRGGNWQSDSKTANTTFRGYYGAAGEKNYNGTSFRCVKDETK